MISVRSGDPFTNMDQLESQHVQANTPIKSVWCNYLSIPKRQRYSRSSLGIDK